MMLYVCLAVLLVVAGLLVLLAVVIGDRQQPLRGATEARIAAALAVAALVAVWGVNWSLTY